MKKIQIISDANQRSLKIKLQLLKEMNKKKINKQNIIIVIGGDGFMLQTLKKIKNLENFFMVLIQEIMASL